MSRNPTLDMPKSQMYRDMTALGFYDLDGWTMVCSEMRAYQYGFQTLLELIDRVGEDWWPLTCSLERLEEWEGILKIPTRSQASLEARRQGVLALLSLGGEDRTPAGAQRLLAAAGLEGTVTENCQARKVTVRITGLGEGYEDPGPCKARLRGLLPAHLLVEYVDARSQDASS